MPLRKATVLGAFATASFLPHVYGVAIVGLTQFDESRKLWLVADHAIANVDNVTVEDVSVGEWQFRNDVDATGHAVSLVEFGQPQDPQTSIKAKVRGKLHPVTGALMENPADIAWSILTSIVGRDESEAQFSDFRTDCDRLGIIAGGVVDDAATPQTVLRTLCQSVGAIFCGDGDQLARVWPEGADVIPSETIDVRHTLTASADLGDIVNDLTIEFAFAAGQANASIQYDAPDSVAAYDRRSASLSAPWVNEPRVAASVAARLLRLQSRPQWVCVASGIDGVLRVGQAVTLAHPRLPIAGDFLIQRASNDLGNWQASPTFIVPAGDAPGIRLVQQSGAFDVPADAGIMVETVGDQRRLRLFNEGEPRTPMAFAAVSVDGSPPRTTDANGVVEFPASMVPPGTHVLDITKQDGTHAVAQIIVGNG